MRYMKCSIVMDAHSKTTGEEKSLLDKPVPLDQVAIHPNFRPHDGVVLVSPIIYSIFLGHFWTTDAGHIQRMNSLRTFLSDLPFSGFMNVLSQYGCGFGAANAGCSLQSETKTIPGDTAPFSPQEHLFGLTITDSFVQDMLQKELLPPPDNPTGAAFLPNPGNPPTICVIVYLADNINVTNIHGTAKQTCLSSEFGDFGYHNHFTTAKGDLLAYAVVSSANDYCVTTVCKEIQGTCPLSSVQDQLARQTMVTSHEYAEMLTNPSDGGWFCDKDGPDSGREVADITQGVFPDPTASGTISIGSTRTWTVQKIYSVTDALAGRDPAVASADSPLPKLPLAPIPRRVPLARIHELHRIEKFLPLPNAYYDAEGQRKWDEEATRLLLQRLFNPYRPKDLVPDLAGFLRHIANVIEKEGKAN
jgi:hypothetical protein